MSYPARKQRDVDAGVQFPSPLSTQLRTAIHGLVFPWLDYAFLPQLTTSSNSTTDPPSCPSPDSTSDQVDVQDCSELGPPAAKLFSKD